MFDHLLKLCRAGTLWGNDHTNAGCLAMNIIKHVVADLERIRALLQEQAEKPRTWQDSDAVVEIDEAYVDDMRMASDTRRVLIRCAHHGKSYEF